MHEEPTTAVIQRDLEALPGDTATDPVVRELERAVGRLHLLCASARIRSSPTGAHASVHGRCLVGPKVFTQHLF
jgi:hypothetical protein